MRLTDCRGLTAEAPAPISDADADAASTATPAPSLAALLPFLLPLPLLLLLMLPLLSLLLLLLLLLLLSSVGAEPAFCPTTSPAPQHDWMSRVFNSAARPVDSFVITVTCWSSSSVLRTELITTSRVLAGRHALHRLSSSRIASSTWGPAQDKDEGTVDENGYANHLSG